MPSKYRMTMTIGHDPVTGKGIRKTFAGKTKRECQQKMDEFKYEAATGKKLHTGITTFSVWADNWLTMYKDGFVADSTLRGYELCIKHLNRAFGKQALNTITPEMCMRFFSSKTDLSNSMLNKIKMTMSSVFEAAIDNGLAFRNPVKNIKIPKGKPKEEKRVYTLEDFHLVKEYAKRNKRGLGAYIILSTGVRRGELMGLIPEKDFDLDNNRIRIQRTVQESSGYIQVKNELKNHDRCRVIPISPEDSAFLKSVIPADHRGFLFHSKTCSSEHEKPMAPSNWKRYILDSFYSDLDNDLSEENKKNGANRKIEHLTPHELRHSYGTMLFKIGNDAYTVQRILGHHSMEVTMGIYVHDDITDVESRLILQ